MVVKLYSYNVLSALKTIDNIDLFDQSDSDVDSFVLDENRILGEGSGKYTHADNANQGDIILNCPIGKDISSYDYLFVWVRTNSANNFDIDLQSSAGNYDTFRITSSATTINTWHFVKLDLSSPTSQTGTFVNTDLTKLRLYSSTANQEVYLNFMALAYKSFEFVSDIVSVLQGIATNINAINSNFNILGRNGGISINQGSQDNEFDIPVFFKGSTAFQKFLELKLLLDKGFHLLLELEQYAFYPILLDGAPKDEMMKEESETSDLTQFDLSIQAHVYNND